MGDVRFESPYHRVRDAANPVAALASLSDEEVIAALAAASREANPYLANVLATEALNRTRRMGAVTTNLGEGVIAADEHGDVSFVNPAAERMIGRGRDIVGTPIGALVHGENGEPDLGEVLAFLTPGSVLHGRRLRLKRGNGRTVPVAATITALLPFGARSEEEAANEAPGGFVVILRDVTPDLRVEAERKARTARLRRQNAALVALAKRVGSPAGDGEVIGEILRVATETLHASRVGIWRFDDEGQALQLERLVVEGEDQGDGGGSRMSAREFPDYFAALEGARALAAHDARTDPRTRAFTRDYLVPLGITSMLDSPIRAAGRLHGVLCIEQVGPPRRWAPDEEQFAASLAALVSLAIEAGERERAVARLRESEETHRAIFHSVNDLIFVQDPVTGAVLDTNGKVEEALGYTREEARRLHPDDLGAGPPYTAEMMRVWIEKTIREGPQVVEWLTKDKAGQPIWVEVNLKLAVIGGAERILAVIRDIRERKAAEAELERYRERLEDLVEERTRDLRKRELHLAHAQRLAQVGSWEWNAATEEIEWSEEMYRILGTDPSRGPPSVQELLPMFPPGDREIIEREVRRLVEEGGEFHVEHRMRCRGGERWLATRAAAIRSPDGRTVRIVGAAQDVTDQKKAEERIGSLVEELRDRLRELAVANEELESFAATVSHDLRGPLRAMGYLAGVVDEESGGALPPASSEALWTLRSEAERLGGVITRLLERAKAGREDREAGRPT